MDKLVHPGIGFAVMTNRPQLLAVAMTSLRQKAKDGTLTGEDLDVVLNTLEEVTDSLIEARMARFEDEGEEE